MADSASKMYKRIFAVLTEEMQSWMNDRLAGLLKSLGIDTAQLRGMVSNPALSDPYRVLGLDKSASDEEVKTRFRELLRKLHPDTSGIEGTAFLLQLVIAAYEMIRIERGWQ
jgi:DnaJ-class molecular chaperone